MVYRDRTETVYIALGSNLNDPFQSLCQALCYLRQHVGVLRRLSDVVSSPPWDGSRQPMYLNLVAEVETSLTPLVLLAILQDIEKEMGRPVTRPKWSARPIDLDILLYGQEVVRLSALKIPHPGLYWRPFVLVPLLQVAPEVVDPVSGVPLRYFPGNQPGAVRQAYSAHTLWTQISSASRPEQALPD